MSAEMDVSVREIGVPSEDGTHRKYFLRVDQRGRDLGSGFNVLLTDGQLAWRGEVTEEVVRAEAAELEMPGERYVQDLQQALTGAESSVTYTFTLSPPPTDTTPRTTLAYEKVQKDISFRLGWVELGAVGGASQAVRDLLDLGVRRTTRLQRQNHLLQEESLGLRAEQEHVTAELRRYAAGKQALEAEMFSRFVVVLNAKKQKIRALQQNVGELQSKLSRRSEKPSKSQQVEKSDDEYGGSTEEEEERGEEERGEEARGEEAAGPSSPPSASRDDDSDSLLDDDTNDITDVAPCRKRRFRRLPPTSDPATSHPAPPEKTPTHKRRRDPPAGGRGADRPKASRRQTPPGPDPSTEDLFDDF